MIRQLILILSATSGAVPTPSVTRADAVSGVRRLIEIENEMYSSYDLRVARQVYAPDIHWQNPFGIRFSKEADLEKFLSRLFSRPGFRAARQVDAPVISDIRLLSPTSASAWTEESSEGQVRRDGTAVGLRRSHVLYALQRRGGRWMITDEMIMDERDDAAHE